MTYELIQYNRHQIGNSKKGKVILTQKNCNGFLEKIIELGFADSVFGINYTEKKDITYCFEIGTFYNIKTEREENKRIAEAVKPLLELLKTF